MFTFPGNFIWITFNPYSSIFFPATRRKPKLFQTGSRSSHYGSSVTSSARADHELCVQGKGTEMSVHSVARRMPRSPRHLEPSPTCCWHICNWGQGEDSATVLVSLLWAHTEEMEPLTAPYIRPPPGLPALVALSSAMWLGTPLQGGSELLLPFVHISASPKHPKLRFLLKS